MIEKGKNIASRIKNLRIFRRRPSQESLDMQAAGDFLRAFARGQTPPGPLSEEAAKMVGAAYEAEIAAHQQDADIRLQERERRREYREWDDGIDYENLNDW